MVPRRGPIAVPHFAVAGICARDSGAAAIDALRMIVVAAVEIAQCQVSEVNVADIPGVVLRFVAARSLPEKCKFKTEGSAVGGLDVAGRVPPFGLKLGMSKKVPWKFIAITRQGKAIWRVERRKEREEQRRAEGPTLHARPQRGSIARRF